MYLKCLQTLKSISNLSVILFSLCWEVGRWDRGTLTCFGRWPSSSPFKLPRRGLSPNEVFQSQVLQPGNNLKRFRNAIHFTALLCNVIWLGLSLSSHVGIQGVAEAITHAHGSGITPSSGSPTVVLNSLIGIAWELARTGDSYSPP